MATRNCIRVVRAAKMADETSGRFFTTNMKTKIFGQNGPTKLSYLATVLLLLFLWTPRLFGSYDPVNCSNTVAFPCPDQSDPPPCPDGDATCPTCPPGPGGPGPGPGGHGG